MKDDLTSMMELRKTGKRVNRKTTGIVNFQTVPTALYFDDDDLLLEHPYTVEITTHLPGEVKKTYVIRPFLEFDAHRYVDIWSFLGRLSPEAQKDFFQNLKRK